MEIDRLKKALTSASLPHQDFTKQPVDLHFLVNIPMHQKCPSCGTKLQLPSAELEVVRGYAFQRKAKVTTKKEPFTIEKEGVLEL